MAVTSHYTSGFGFIMKVYLKHWWYIDRHACTRPHALTRTGFSFVLLRNSDCVSVSGIIRFAWAVLSVFATQVAELLTCIRLADWHKYLPIIICCHWSLLSVENTFFSVMLHPKSGLDV